MSQNSALLRAIPKVDELLALPEMAAICMRESHFTVTSAIRETLDTLRAEILSGNRTQVPTAQDLLPQLTAAVQRKSILGLRPVINGTGIVLHTNFGRATLAAQAAEAAARIATQYSTLEYDVERGERGDRCSHVENLLRELTGAEDALVVNNNAAAVLLALTSMTRGREVIVSRGELVEIGGSFRVPAIMQQSGSTLVEVGTTNKTRLSDYENAIVPEKTGALLKVHTSNFKIVGFTEEVSLSELKKLSLRYDIPVIHDLGSGALCNLAACGIVDEPNVLQSVQAGADVICFSGDKLLGGPQAGILIGAKRYIGPMKKNPLLRALRIDKMTLAALEATLRLYRDPRDAFSSIPVIRMLSSDIGALRAKARTLTDAIRATGLPCFADTIDENGQVGGGSVPTQLLPTAAVAISPQSISVVELERRLRLGEPAIVGRIARDCFLLDVRTIEDGDFPVIVERLRDCLA